MGSHVFTNFCYSNIFFFVVARVVVVVIHVFTEQGYFFDPDPDPDSDPDIDACRRL